MTANMERFLNTVDENVELRKSIERIGRAKTDEYIRLVTDLASENGIHLGSDDFILSDRNEDADLSDEELSNVAAGNLAYDMQLLLEGKKLRRR